MLIQLILIQVITFVIIVVVLKKILYTETTKEADRLKKLREEFFLKEKELQAKVDAARREADARAVRAEEEASNLLDAKEKEAEKTKEELIQKARGQAEEMVRAAVNSKTKIREEIELDIKKKVPAAAVRIFKEVLPRSAAEIVHSDLIEEVAAKIKKLEKSLFKANIKSGELLSPYPVKKADKEKIISAISEKTGHDISLTEKEEKMLVAGVIIRLESLVIDGSLENKLRQIEERLG